MRRAWVLDALIAYFFLSFKYDENQLPIAGATPAGRSRLKPLLQILRKSLAILRGSGFSRDL
jgi:hypothetical protein